MKVIGITGGIGSGKSLVANIMKEQYHAFVADSDGIAKAQMEPGAVSYCAVVDYFGKEILAEDGSIDRKKLAEIVFADPDKRNKVNELTHPKVLKVIMEEIEVMRNRKDVPYFIVETALMLECGYDFICDEVWYVQSTPEIRRSRLKESRGYSDEKITSIFTSQSKDEEFLRKFPIVIENNGDLKQLEEQVDSLLRKE